MGLKRHSAFRVVDDGCAAFYRIRVVNFIKPGAGVILSAGTADITVKQIAQSPSANTHRHGRHVFPADPRRHGPRRCPPDRGFPVLFALAVPASGTRGLGQPP